MKTLETKRLILRDWEQNDVQDLFEYASDCRVGPNAGWPVHENIAASEEIVKMFMKNDDVLALELKDGNKVIGSIGLHKRTNPYDASMVQYEIGYTLSPTYWGRGLMPEAVHAVLDYGFNELELTEIWCGHFDFNEKSKRVVEKTGFIYQYTTEKTLPLLDGKVVNELYYKLDRVEYLSKEMSGC